MTDTRRFREVGLVTHARTKFIYGRIRQSGKVHMYTGAIVRWNQPPFPEMTWTTRCGGRQFSHVYPEYRESFDQAELCQRCFPNIVPSTLQLRQMERREHIVETVEAMEGEWTYRDIWRRADRSYNLCARVVEEMRLHGLVREVSSPQGQLPKRFITNH
jgi:hypothetical protein